MIVRTTGINAPLSHPSDQFEPKRIRKHDRSLIDIIIVLSKRDDWCRARPFCRKLHDAKVAASSVNYVTKVCFAEASFLTVKG